VFFSFMTPQPQSTALFPYTTLFRSKQSGYNILFDQRIIPKSATVNVHYENVQLNKVLDELLVPFGIKYKQAGKNIVLNKDATTRSEEHTSELQSRENLVCRLLLEKK